MSDKRTLYSKTQVKRVKAKKFMFTRGNIILHQLKAHGFGLFGCIFTFLAFTMTFPSSLDSSQHGFQKRRIIKDNLLHEKIPSFVLVKRMPHFFTFWQEFFTQSVNCIHLYCNIKICLIFEVNFNTIIFQIDLMALSSNSSS